MRERKERTSVSPDTSGVLHAGSCCIFHFECLSKTQRLLGFSAGGGSGKGGSTGVSELRGVPLPQTTIFWGDQALHPPSHTSQC